MDPVWCDVEWCFNVPWLTLIDILWLFRRAWESLFASQTHLLMLGTSFICHMIYAIVQQTRSTLILIPSGQMIPMWWLHDSPMLSLRMPTSFKSLTLTRQLSRSVLISSLLHLTTYTASTFHLFLAQIHISASIHITSKTPAEVLNHLLHYCFRPGPIGAQTESYPLNSFSEQISYDNVIF